MKQLIIEVTNDIFMTLVITPITESTNDKVINYTYKDFVGSIPANEFSLELKTLNEDIKIIQKAIMQDIVNQYKLELDDIELILGGL